MQWPLRSSARRRQEQRPTYGSTLRMISPSHLKAYTGVEACPSIERLISSLLACRPLGIWLRQFTKLRRQKMSLQDTHSTGCRKRTGGGLSGRLRYVRMRRLFKPIPTRRTKLARRLTHSSCATGWTPGGRARQARRFLPSAARSTGGAARIKRECRARCAYLLAKRSEVTASRTVRMRRRQRNIAEFQGTAFWNHSPSGACFGQNT